MLLSKFLGKVMDGGCSGRSRTRRRFRGRLTRSVNQILIGKDLIAEVIAKLLRLGVEPSRVHRSVKTPGVKRQGEIVTYPGNMVLGCSILKQRIGAGTVGTLHVFKLDDCHMSAGRRLEGGGVMNGRGLRAGKLRRESADQQESRDAEPIGMRV